MPMTAFGRIEPSGSSAALPRPLHRRDRLERRLCPIAPRLRTRRASPHPTGRRREPHTHRVDAVRARRSPRAPGARHTRARPHRISPTTPSRLRHPQNARPRAPPSFRERRLASLDLRCARARSSDFRSASSPDASPGRSSPTNSVCSSNHQHRSSSQRPARSQPSSSPTSSQPRRPGSPDASNQHKYSNPNNGRSAHAAPVSRVAAAAPRLKIAIDGASPRQRERN